MVASDPEERRDVPGRMDFVAESKVVDERRGVVEVVMRPDPRRYDTVRGETGTHYIDRYLKLLIPADEMLNAMAREMEGLPIYSLEPTIASATEYASQRGVAISTELETGVHSRPAHSSKPHTPFVDNVAARDVAFLSIDVIGGTAMRAHDPEAFDLAYGIVFREFASTIGQFHGAILKATGDGCIAYIDHPAFTSTCDAAADLGLTLLIILREAVTPALKAAGLAPVQIRIGADFGRAEVRSIEVPATGFIDLDVASDALNRAVKIEQSCAANEFRVGYDLYRLMHVKWLERGEVVEFDSKTVGRSDYQVFRLV